MPSFDFPSSCLRFPCRRLFRFQIGQLYNMKIRNVTPARYFCAFFNNIFQINYIVIFLSIQISPPKFSGQFMQITGSDKSTFQDCNRSPKPQAVPNFGSSLSQMRQRTYVGQRNLSVPAAAANSPPEHGRRIWVTSAFLI